ncbi:MAG: DUF5020 domain-containing protein [Bacteroidetes bacterium]|nr:MAG: DUF5020 domain-containing protein [Bacteroidota bacterium]
MRTFLLLSFLCVFTLALEAQNIQLHYDLGKDRQYLTSTVEFFKPDKLGSTFFFVDMNYDMGDVEGVSLAYWEIARAFKVSKKIPLSVHVEYNGGFGQWYSNNLQFGGAYTINDAFLGGVEYSWNAKDYSKGFTLQTLYKYIRGKHNASFQLTGVWYLHLLDKKLSLTGFADFWREDFLFANNNLTTETKYVLLTEPQIWYNFNKHFSAGSEIEISSNFGGMEGFNIMPTLAVKYSL